MTHYEKVTREEIARRNYTEGTTRAYLPALQRTPLPLPIDGLMGQLAPSEN